MKRFRVVIMVGTVDILGCMYETVQSCYNGRYCRYPRLYV